MPKMFISGSMSTNYISDEVIKSLELSIERNYQILVGDARGVDKNIQDFLKMNNYKNVQVYHIGEKPRNISDYDWEVYKVEVNQSDSKMFKNGRYTRLAQMQKDIKMTNDADFGLVIWQDVKKNRFGNLQVSKGSLSNIFNLLLQNKPVGLYLLSNKDKGILKYRQLEEFEGKVISSLVHPKTKEYYKKIKSDNLKQNNSISVNNRKKLQQTSLF